MTDQSTRRGKETIVIDRDIYEYLGPLHRATADILVSKGRLIIKEAQKCK